MDHSDDWSLLLVTLITCYEANIVPIFTDEETEIKSCHLAVQRHRTNSSAGLRGSPFP